MKRLFLPTILILTLILAACSGLPSSPPTPLPTVALNQQPSAASSGGVSASGEVVPAQHIELAFTLLGRVQIVNVKVGDTVKSGDTLLALDTTALTAEVTRAEGDLKAAQANLDLLTRQGEVHERREAAQGQVQAAQGALDSAKAALAQATLVAPFEGTVTELNVMAGDTVSPGQVVLVLADLNHLQIETTDLSERDIVNVKIGQNAKVDVKALNQNFNGKVIAISPMADKVGGDVVYQVTIELDSQPQGLMWGMSVDVEIQIK